MIPNSVAHHDRRTRGGRRIAGALALGAVLALATVSCGSDGGGRSPSAAGEKPAQKAAAFTRLDPGQFGARMGEADAYVVNVHIPYEGEIENTDAFVPFDRIVADPRLPTDKGKEVLLYCKTGHMSQMAGEALGKAGYTNVSHLEGGMKAWEAAGKPLVHRPQTG